jgi:hypothetical protein
MAHAQSPLPPRRRHGLDAAALYQQHCASCHGAQRTGGMGPALLPESLERLRRPEALKVIGEGRTATQMPGFAATLSSRRDRRAGRLDLPARGARARLERRRHPRLAHRAAGRRNLPTAGVARPTR